MAVISRLVLTVLLGSAFVVGQDHTIRVDVRTVSVGVDVFDSKGRPVSTLAKEDFQIYEDDQRREVLNFASFETPYNLVLLFDCSESTEKHWPAIQNAVSRFSLHRRPLDRVMVAAFGSKIEVIQSFAARNEDIRFVRESRVCSGTHLHEALDWAAQQLRPLRTRKGIVVLTDGVDSADEAEMQQDYRNTLDLFASIGIPLYIVAIGTDLNPTWGVSAHPPEVRSRLERLAAVSGGRVVFPKGPEDVAPLYEAIADELGTAYSLGYAPANPNPDGKRHRIQIRVSNPEFSVRQSRESYVWD